uniref:Uncharacterized protein n=1 Tax=Rhizophora mucronata TaxID=61149 RepID=A0A2P2PM01_RHIMU
MGNAFSGHHFVSNWKCLSLVFNHLHCSLHLTHVFIV